MSSDSLLGRTRQIRTATAGAERKMVEYTAGSLMLFSLTQKLLDTNSLARVSAWGLCRRFDIPYWDMPER